MHTWRASSCLPSPPLQRLAINLVWSTKWLISTYLLSIGANVVRRMRNTVSRKENVTVVDGQHLSVKLLIEDTWLTVEPG